MEESMASNLKKMAALSGTKLIKDGQVVGLGTGSTVYYAIKELARKIEEDGIAVQCIPTSTATENIARKNNLPLTSLEEHQEIDIAIDGADQIDGKLNLVKGGKGALTREKIIASSSKKFVVIVDESKLVETLNIPVPVEVLPFNWKQIESTLKAMKGKAKLRRSEGSEPFITDNKNYILDVNFGEITEPRKLELEINSIIGIVENGIFTNLTDEVHVGTKEGVKILKP